MFHHMLMPVCFDRDQEAEIKQAIEVANHLECDLCLLHVVVPAISISTFFDPSFAALQDEQLLVAESQMLQLIKEHRYRMMPGKNIRGNVQAGSWQAAIKDCIISQRIDLVLDTQQDRKIDVNQLAEQLQCPVLTLTPGFRFDQLQQIVVPVNDFLPLKKLTAATYLARKSAAVIHLTGHRKHASQEYFENRRCISQAYSLVKNYAEVRVYCSGKEENPAEGALDYANRVAAGLIVVNPGKESKLGRWNSQYLHKQSTIPVLTIARPRGIFA